MLSFNRFSKVLVLLTLFAVLACNEDDKASVEVIHHGDVFLNTQEAMDRFAASGYTRINGNLRIGTGVSGVISDITTILLTELTYVQGIVNISQTSLANLNGLENLDSISSHLLISGNPQLKTLEGLVSLKGYDAMSITNNDILENFDALQNADSASNITIANNPVLNSIAGLTGLKFVDFELTLTDNPSLSDLSGLNELINVDGHFAIVRNGVTSLSGLQKLEEVGSASILENENLTSLVGLDKLERIGSTLEIFNNQNLMSLDGLQALEEIGSMLIIRNNNALNDFCAISNLISVSGLEKILLNGNNYNPNLEDFNKGDCEQ